jgi:ribosomal protein L37E
MKQIVCRSCGRVITNPDAGFCGRCGAKLFSQSRWWQIATWAAGAVAIVFLIAFSQLVVNPLTKPRSVDDAGSGPPTAHEPEPSSISAPRLAFDVAGMREGDSGSLVGLKLTFLTVEQPVAVQRVVINGRAGEEGCDFTREALVKACLDQAQKATAPGREAVPDDFEAEYNGHKGQADEGLVERSEEFCRHHNDRAATDDEFTACWDQWLEHQGFAPGTPLIPADLKRLAEVSVREGTAEYAEDKAACANGGVFKAEGLDDQRVEPWPQMLQTGDSMTINVSCGDRIVSAQIISNRGEATYQLDVH